MSLPFACFARFPDCLNTAVAAEVDYKDRIDCLRKTGANIEFLSQEPLLDDIGELDLFDIDWVIVGGESGPGARPMAFDWARSIRDQRIDQQVPFFLGQAPGGRA